jgi:hypothetical protein
MATYQIQINERIAVGKHLVALLRSMPDAVSFKQHKAVPAAKSKLYNSIDHGFRDVRLMMDGKKRKKTLDEFLDEVRNNND